MTARARSKYADSSSRTSSGSRASEIGVNPTRSANSRDTILRSATGEGDSLRAGGMLGSAAGRPGGAPSGAPHSAQNRPPPERVPHAAQATEAGRPHSAQNLAPGGNSVPQPAQEGDMAVTGGRSVSLGGAEPLTHRGEQRPGDLGLLHEQRLGLPMGERCRDQFGLRGHRGRPWPAVDERDLPEVLPRTE